MRLSRSFKQNNQRRCELIEKQLREGLTTTEESELYFIEHWVDDWIAQRHLLPFDYLQKIWKEYMPACEHKDFHAEIEVHRITDKEGGPVVAYSADVRIRCKQCTEDFCFLGMPGGLHPLHPTINLYATEARLPIRPSSEMDQPLPKRKGVTGYSVTQQGGSE